MPELTPYPNDSFGLGGEGKTFFVRRAGDSKFFAKEGVVTHAPLRLMPLFEGCPLNPDGYVFAAKNKEWHAVAVVAESTQYDGSMLIVVIYLFSGNKPEKKERLLTLEDMQRFYRVDLKDDFNETRIFESEFCFVAPSTGCRLSPPFWRNFMDELAKSADPRLFISVFRSCFVIVDSILQFQYPIRGTTRTNSENALYQHDVYVSEPCNGKCRDIKCENLLCAPEKCACACKKFCSCIPVITQWLCEALSENYMGYLTKVTACCGKYCIDLMKKDPALRQKIMRLLTACNERISACQEDEDGSQSENDLETHRVNTNSFAEQQCDDDNSSQWESVKDEDEDVIDPDAAWKKYKKQFL